MGVHKWEQLHNLGGLTGIGPMLCKGPGSGRVKSVQVGVSRVVFYFLAQLLDFANVSSGPLDRLWADGFWAIHGFAAAYFSLQVFVGREVRLSWDRVIAARFGCHYSTRVRPNRGKNFAVRAALRSSVQLR